MNRTIEALRGATGLIRSLEQGLGATLNPTENQRRSYVETDHTFKTNFPF